MLGADPRKPRIVAVGDNVVDVYVELGQVFPGGNCVNVSVFAARAGGQASYIGRVGFDEAGDLLVEALRSEGVDTSHLDRIDGATAHCVISHDNGDRIFLSSDLGVSRFVPSAAELEYIGEADVVHVGASSGLDGVLEQFTQRTALSYDFATSRDAQHITRTCKSAFLATFSGGDLSSSEAEHLLASAIDAGARWVLVTRGSRGAVLAHAEARWTTPARQSRAIDTLGAGDSFIGRLLVGLLRGDAPAEALSDASSVAARTCETYGAFGHPRALNRFRLLTPNTPANARNPD